MKLNLAFFIKKKETKIGFIVSDEFIVLRAKS
jgi:hypothetical protein